MMIAVSACLMGIPCRYDGKAKYSPQIIGKLKDKEIIAICPEVLGGLPVPRKPVEIMNGTGSQVLRGERKVYDKEGKDLTSFFLKGARLTLQLLQIHEVKMACLKENSPSCGVNYVYDGKFRNQKLKGSGITSSMLVSNGIDVFSEYEIARIR